MKLPQSKNQRQIKRGINLYKLLRNAIQRQREKNIRANKQL